jgi:2-hydroxy-6-oxonona-2,4-dienedioate hydrolase
LDAEMPAAIVARVEARSRRIETPCGDGKMVWRLWGEGPPLVLLHGGYGSWTHWLRNIERLSAQRLVIAPDMPGLGDSAMPEQPFGAESLAAIISRGLDIVVPPPQQIDLCGFSFGSVLGGHVAAQQAGRIASFLMVGPGAIGDPRPATTDLRRVEKGMSETEIVATQRRNLAVLMFADPAKIDDLAIHLQITNTRRARLRSRPIARSDTLRRILPQVPSRLGVLFGEHDITAAPYIEEKLAFLRAIRPRLYTDVVAGAGHWLQWEAAARFEVRLLGFLACTA